MAESARTLQGVVVSDKMMKAIVVAVERKVKHPLLGKIIKRTTKFHVQDVNNTAKEGDIVEIKETRPVSKTIAWTLVRVVKTAS
ncbi:30S ribosomal protein S17 [Succinimonas sp.]|jgi:small subunit ribosomal protein S17|uniref:30S ribosomal protein S17 n=1 Tax=Succinimonas sp. TaxID=1936151 RepID=UPI002E8C5528|nr:30S ribosomal protein S17 [Succinimonas sp.]